MGQMLGDHWGRVECAGPGMSCPSLCSMEDGLIEVATPPLPRRATAKCTWEWEEEMPGPKYGGRDGYLQA